MLYRNNLKNREFGKAGDLDLQQAKPALSEAMLVTWPSEAAAKMRMPAKPKTDSSSCFGILRRMLFFDALRFLLFFALCFTFLYILIDYSIHARSFVRVHFSPFDLGIYYLCHFTRRASLILTFAMMLTTIKTLLGLNIRGELSALFGAGLSRNQLIRPLSFLALLTTLFLYANGEYFQPLQKSVSKHLKKATSIESRSILALIICKQSPWRMGQLSSISPMTRV